MQHAAVRANTEPELPTAPLHAGVCPTMSRSAPDIPATIPEAGAGGAGGGGGGRRKSCKSVVEEQWSEERVEWAGITYARNDLPPFEMHCPAQLLRATAFEGEGGEAAMTAYNPTHCLWLATAAALAYRTPAEIKHVVTRIWGWDVVEVFEDVATDTHAFGMHNGHTIIISFRGTTGKQNWMTNLNYFPTEPFPTLKGAKIHNGFNTAFLSVFERVRSFILKARAANPAMTLYLGGHSLGGALANLLLAYLSMPSNICSSALQRSKEEEVSAGANTLDSAESATGAEGKKGRLRCMVSCRKGKGDSASLDGDSGEFNIVTSETAPTKTQSLSHSAPVSTVPSHATPALMRSEPILQGAKTSREKVNDKKKKKETRKLKLSPREANGTKSTSGATANPPKLQRIKPVCDLGSLCSMSSRQPANSTEPHSAATAEGTSEEDTLDNAKQTSSELSRSTSSEEDCLGEESSEESETTISAPATSSTTTTPLDSISSEEVESSIVDPVEDNDVPKDETTSLSSPHEPFSPIRVNGVYTFGQPKVGNDVFVCALKRHTPYTAFYRITHNNDIVPTVPRKGYAHCGRRMFVSQDGLLVLGEEAAREVRELNRGGAAAVRRTKGGLTDHFMRAYLDHVLGHYRLNTKDSAATSHGELLGLLEVEQTVLRAEDVCMAASTEEFMAALQGCSVADTLQSEGLAKSKRAAIKEAKKKANEKRKVLKKKIKEKV